MSGDVQPRKRKDKKKKKDEPVAVAKEEPIVTAIPVPVHTGPNDELIHIHKESRLGGNICAKIVFFLLLGTIAVAVGLIITEYKGSGDVESPADSPWSKALDGWVDDGLADKHDHDDIHPLESEEHDDHDDGSDDHDHIPSHDEGSEEAGSHEEEEEEHIIVRRSTPTESASKVSGEENEGSEENGEGADHDEGSQETDKDEEEQGFLELAVQSLFGVASGSPIAGEQDGPTSAETEDQASDENGDETEIGGDEENEDEEEDKNNDIDSAENAGSDENEDEGDKVDEDASNQEEEEEGDKDEDGESNEGDNNADGDSNEEGDKDTDGDSNEVAEPDAEPEGNGDSGEENNISGYNKEDDNEEEDDKDDDDDDVDENNNKDTKAEDVSEETAQFYAKGSLEEDGDTDDTVSDEIVHDGYDFIEEREVPDLGEAPFGDAGLDDLAGEPDEFEEIQDQPEPGNKPDNEESGGLVGIALKFGVGVAIIIVAHVVLVKKWNQSEGGATTLDPSGASEGEPVPLVPRKQTLIPPSAQLGSDPDEEEPEDYDFSNEEDEEVPDSPRIVPVRKDYSKLVQEDSDEEEVEEVEDEELEDEELEEEEAAEEEFDKVYGYTFQSAPPQTPQVKGHQEVEESDEVEDEEEEVDEEEVADEEELEEEEEDDDLARWQRDRGDQRSEDEASEGEASEDETPAPAQPRGGGPRPGGPQDTLNEIPAESANEAPAPVVQKTEEDRVFEKAQAQMDENPDLALKTLDTFLSSSKNQHPSARVALLQARALDNLAQEKRSNDLLDDVIEAYFKLLRHPDLADDEFRKVADRCIDRVRFRGHHHRAPQIHQRVIERFPNDPSPKNQLAVTYLMTNSVAKAKKVLEEVLAQWPNNGFALVHYGFVLKTSGNNVSEGVRYLQAGIDSKEPGTMDARFLFHLGDGLNRLGRPQEALRVYELGVKEGLFRSKYQRSLYNVDRLTARPWWTLKETTYEDFLRKLEQNWKGIRDEGLAILRSQSETGAFKDEAENLRDVGDWKQLELYARGRRLNSNCARAPLTCGLIAGFAAARDCRRGQVKFSVMHPGTHVWPHCGPTNCRLRSHLGLVVPPGTAIRVADVTRSWEEGKVMVFDDSFEHEVWHNGSSFRLVLIVDVWHPELTQQEKLTLPAI